jgi:DNA-binding ferritin-like protein (Dps family)
MSNLFNSANAPTKEPSEITAGDLTQWRREDLSDYDNSLYTLTYSARLSGTGATEITVTATADGSDYIVSIGSTVTAAMATGHYYWQAYLTRDSDSERIVIGSGTWKVLENLDTDTSDPRSHARKMVDMLEAVLENRATNDVINYAIGARQITKMLPDELTKWRAHYRSELATEDAKIARDRGDPNPNHITARFI